MANHRRGPRNYGIVRKVLSQGTHMCNMKAPSLVVTKVWPRLKFLSTHHTLTPMPTRTRLPGHTSRLAKKNSKRMHM